MSEPQHSARTNSEARTIEAVTEHVAGAFIHHLAPAFRSPARLVCPSGEAEQAVVDAVSQAAAALGIPVEVIDLRPAPAERLDAVTARLDGWHGSLDRNADTSPTLLILRGFDVFGDDDRDAAGDITPEDWWTTRHAP